MRATVGSLMTGALGYKQCLSQTANGLVLILHVWTYVAFTNRAGANIASVYFTCQKIVSFLQAKCPACSESRKLPSHLRFICWHWNKQQGQGCSFWNCRYEHICYYCAYNPAVNDINHKAMFCLNRPNQQLEISRQPKPLFSWTHAAWYHSGTIGHSWLIHTLVWLTQIVHTLFRCYIQITARIFVIN